MKNSLKLGAFKAFELQKEALIFVKGGIFCSEVPGVIQHLRNQGHTAQADSIEDMWESGNLQCEEDLIVEY